MKTTIDIPDEDLNRILRFTGASTKRDAILVAVRKFNREMELAEINRTLKGNLSDMMTVEELYRNREETKPDCLNENYR
jgi:hypothetical protein